MRETVIQPGSLNLAFLEDLYAQYLRDPASVSADWQEYFGNLRNGDQPPGRNVVAPNFAGTSIFNPPAPRFASGEPVNRVEVEEQSTRTFRTASTS